ncbi:40S small subunit processome assembly factor 1 [Spinachia spinachia]
MDIKEDADGLFLERVLDQLYEFGDAPASKKKSQKKKKRKSYEEEEEEEEEEEFPSVTDHCSEPEDHQVVCVGDEEQQQQQQQPKPEQTGAAVQRASQVEVVAYQDPRKKPRTKPTAAADKMPALKNTTDKKESDQPEELNLEKARLDVHRFGITGYKKEQQRVFEQDRAVMLGARPPKKDFVNYRMLQQQMKEKKQKAKEEVQPDLKKKKKQSNPRAKKKNVSSGSGSAPTGQVGRFKNGMLILNTNDLQKIKGKKRHK